MAWGLGQPDIARNHGLENLIPEKAAQIGGDLF